MAGVSAASPSWGTGSVSSRASGLTTVVAVRLGGEELAESRGEAPGLAAEVTASSSANVTGSMSPETNGLVVRAPAGPPATLEVYTRAPVPGIPPGGPPLGGGG